MLRQFFGQPRAEPDGSGQLLGLRDGVVLGRRSWGTRGVAQLGTLLAILVVLEFVVFGRYFTGESIPPWDFLGSYNTTAYLWWEKSSFFHPIDWIPNSLAGYPAALILQDSSWYIPVGIAALFGPFTLHASAIVAALHVAFGSVGTYALVKSFRMPFSVATFAAVAGFFAVGYFSNAQHVDIARAYAWAPWILLVLSPRWPWRKFWSIPLASLVLWQAVTGMYPGMIFTSLYVGIVWVAVYQWQDRPSLSSFIGPVALSAVAAALLCAPRILPYFLLSGDTAAELPDTSKFDLSMVGTLVYGYGHFTGFPNDLSMNSFFLPVTVLVLSCFASLRDGISRLALAIGIPAFALGMPFFPWFDFTQSLPGLGLSRFTMSDFKVFVVLAAVLLASSGMYRLLSRSPMSRTVFWTRFGGAALVAAILFVARKAGPFTRSEWLPGFALLVTVLALILIYRVGRLPSRSYLLATAVVALTALSGSVWAMTTTLTWSTPRVAAEKGTYGASVDTLLTERRSAKLETRRPARIPLGAGYDEGVLFSPVWNGSYYLDRDAVGGYVNVKGSETVNRLTTSLMKPESGPALAEFLAAPGLVLSGESTPQRMMDCVEFAACGDAAALPVRYRPGEFTYTISASEPTLAVLNEAYYTGWEAQACTATDCTMLTTVRNGDGLIQVSLPKGLYDLKLQYHAPGRAGGWGMFALGLVGAFLGAFVRRPRLWDHNRSQTHPDKARRSHA